MALVYDVVICFDTTRSMQKCIASVREHVSEIVTKLFKDIPNIMASIVGFGDYCDNENFMKYIDLCNKEKEIINFITTVPNTNGGDMPEAYEYVLREVQKFSWRSDAKKNISNDR